MLETATIGRNHPCRCGSGRKYKKCCLPVDLAAKGPKTKQQGEPALIVCTPTRGQPTFETLLALRHNMDGVRNVQTMVARKKVIEARNALAEGALKAIADHHFEQEPSAWFVMWCDDDSWWPPSTIKTMLRFFSEAPACDALFGKFGGRMPYSDVFAYKDPKEHKDCYIREGVNCNTGDVIEIAEAGFHFVMMRASLLQRIGPSPFNIPEGSDPRITEDFAFCHRARAAGARLAVATGMPIMHIDPRDGTAYTPGMPAMMMDGNQVAKITLEHRPPSAGEAKTPEMRSYGLAIEQTTIEEERYTAAAHQLLQDRAAISTGKI